MWYQIMWHALKAQYYKAMDGVSKSRRGRRASNTLCARLLSGRSGKTTESCRWWWSDGVYSNVVEKTREDAHTRNSLQLHVKRAILLSKCRWGRCLSFSHLTWEELDVMMYIECASWASQYFHRWNCPRQLLPLPLPFPSPPSLHLPLHLPLHPR